MKKEDWNIGKKDSASTTSNIPILHYSIIPAFYYSIIPSPWACGFPLKKLLAQRSE
jgi:hypothetical protein